MAFGALNGGGTGWCPLACAGVAQDNNTSDLRVQARGLTKEIRIIYVTGIRDPQTAFEGLGRQHIGIGPIAFSA